MNATFFRETKALNSKSFCLLFLSYSSSSPPDLIYAPFLLLFGEMGGGGESNRSTDPRLLRPPPPSEEEEGEGAHALLQDDWPPTPLPLGSQSQFRGRRVRKSSKAQVLDWDLLKEDEEEEGLLIPPFSSFLFPPSEKDQ